MVLRKYFFLGEVCKNKSVLARPLLYSADYSECVFEMHLDLQMYAVLYVFLFFFLLFFFFVFFLFFLYTFVSYHFGTDSTFALPCTESLDTCPGKRFLSTKMFGYFPYFSMKMNVEVLRSTQMKWL